MKYKNNFSRKNIKAIAASILTSLSTKTDLIIELRNLYTPSAVELSITNFVLP